LPLCEVVVGGELTRFAVANLDFAKKDESERSNALIDWTKKHASNILNIKIVDTSTILRKMRNSMK
jgi:pyruvate-formate lyase